MKVIDGGMQQPGFSLGLFDFQNTVVWFSWMRLFFYGVAYLGVMVLQLLQGDFLCLEVWQPVHLLMLVAFASHVGFIEFADREDRSRRAIGFLIGLDVLITAGALWVVGAHHALFISVLLFHVAAGGFFLGTVSALKLALFGVGVFNIVYALQPFLNPAQLTTVWAVANFAPVVVAGLTAFLGTQVQVAGADLQNKTFEIKALTDINELIVENIPSGLLVLDSNFRVLRANEGAAKIFENPALVGKALNEIFLDLEKTLQNFIRGGAPEKVGRFELPFFNYKNEKLQLEVIVSAVARRSGSVRQYICLLQNVTEIKNLEFAMRQKEKLAAVGQLAAGIAHEIRNPLASISGSVQLLQGNLKVQTDEDKKLLAIMIKEIDRLNKLITEFLDFVRPEVRVEDPIQLNSLTKEVLETVRLNEKLAKKVEQTVELRAHGTILGHYDKLKQALMNIVINAYQAMGDTLRPELHVSSYDSGDKVVLVIQDNGIGMTAETVRRIFEPFHTTKANGTGLGLAITHKILETHKARVDIETELGQGAKFVITFPATHPPEDMYLKKQA